MYYVVMTDTFMSGWGRADGKKNKLIFVCDTMDEAEIVKANAEARGDMIGIRIRTTAPHYDENTNFVQYKTKEDYPHWYLEGHFRR